MPGRSLYVVDSRYDDAAAYDDWLTATKPVVTILLEAGAEALA